MLSFTKLIRDQDVPPPGVYGIFYTATALAKIQESGDACPIKNMNEGRFCSCNVIGGIHQPPTPAHDLNDPLLCDQLQSIKTAMRAAPMDVNVIHWTIDQITYHAVVVGPMPRESTYGSIATHGDIANSIIDHHQEWGRRLRECTGRNIDHLHLYW